MKLSKCLVKGSTALFASLLMLVVLNSLVMGQEFFVSPSGSDRNAGTLNSPLASIAAAQTKVRDFKQANPDAAATVYLRGGKYYLSEPVVFTPADSGTEAGPVAYKAYQDEVPLVLGGVKLDGLKWEKSGDNVFKTKVPKGLVFETLFINGQQQVLARYPNYTDDAPAFNGVAEDCLSPERIATWHDPTYGYFHAMHPSRWGGIHYQITGKKNKNEVTMVGGTQNNRGNGKHNKHRFVENIFEELDTANEWYLNRNTSELYVSPAPGVDLKKAEVEVAALEQLFVFKGTEKSPVKHVLIEGLTLKRTIRTFMKTAVRLLRSDWTIYRGGVVHFEGTENCSLKNCELSDLGGNAVFFNLYNKNGLVEGCHIFNCGASGVCFVGDIATAREENYNINEAPDLAKMDFTPGPANNNYPQRCLVDNNLIYNIGNFEKQTAGVHISLAAYITVRRNSIYDVPRAGINISEGKWGGHLLEYNDVFLTVQETHDHGAFNSWGRDRYYTKNRGVAGDRVAKHGYDLVKIDMLDKIVIRNNRWRCDHGWDIDLDDGSAWYEIYNNVCLSGGIKLRDGMLRNVYNNVNINNSMNLHVWLKGSDDVITGNISTHGYFPVGMRNWGKEIDRNLFFQKNSLEKAQSGYRTDKNSVYGDPEFADPANGDYTVGNMELAKAIGWKNFPMDQFGVQKPSLKAIAKKPDFTEIELTPDELIVGVDYMGGVIKNIENDNEKSVAGLPDYKGAKIVKSLTQGMFSVVKLQDDDVVLKIDDEAVNNIQDFTSRIASGKRYKKMSVWRFQKMVVLEMPDPATVPVALNKSDWKVVSADSEAKGYEAKLAIDGDDNTFWHTEFRAKEPPFPHEVVVDMGKESVLHTIEYVARQDGSDPRIKKFRLYLSTDGKAWGEPAIKGKLKHTDRPQSFPIEMVTARYFKLVGVSGYTRNAAAVGEISFFGVPKKEKNSLYDESVPAPTQSKLKYGPHLRHVFDFWQAPSDSPTPLVVVIHGGGWRRGRREDVHKYADVAKLVDSGVSVAAISYRLFKYLDNVQPPVKGPMVDSARAVQFFRSQAKRFNVDPKRIGATGGSAGGCSSLWLAYHDDLADADNQDPVLRESSRLFCAAATAPQTTLDPKLMKKWMPNSGYGAHAFGLDSKQFGTFLANRDKYLALIDEYSPYSLASKDDPPVYLSFSAKPAMGKSLKDPTHSANFGIGLQRRCKKLGISCDVMYPGATGLKDQTASDYLIRELKENR